MPGRSRRKTGIAKKALNLAKKNRRELRGELKYFDIANRGTIAISSDAPLVQNMFSGVVRGTAHNNFLGDEIRIKSLLLRGVILWDTNDPDVVIRICLIRQNDDDTAAPVVMAAAAADENLLAWSATDQMKPLMPLALHNSQKYKVLWDELLIGNPDSVDGLVFKRYFKFNHKMYFNAAGAGKKGSLYLCLISDEPAAGNPPTLDMHSRVRFTDA